ncbi:MAG: acetyl-CoA C-acyltransferase [Gemmatimonadetes bacterium]|nr:acetyl-CoA C-acyltransferase [Gemmatimonadota bacterium]NNM04824.1 acetyl-CoA C-acyltransferase [Gemmatimonadota bacterium]
MSDKERTPVILSGVRTPIGRFLGGLSTLPATQLGALTVQEAVKRAGIDPETVDDVIMGNVVGAGGGQAPARQAAIKGGLPASVPAITINKVCGSGLKAVMLASQAIKAGDIQVAVAGGFESMSNVPFYLRNYRGGVKFGDQPVQDGLIYDGLWCSFGNCHMGGHAEYTADKAGITREEADEFAFNSHMKAVEAIEGGKFKDEILPVEVKHRKGVNVVDTDESPRKDTSLESLARLRPAFPKDAPAGIENLVVTAGNAPGLNDGAASLVVASQAFAEAHGLPIMAYVNNYAVGSTEPQDLFFAPIEAVRKLAEKDGKSLDGYGLFELNEAFAVQAIADVKELGIDPALVNVNGGAVALGHPIGASGARVLVTLLYAMKDRGEASGVAGLCLGGGNAVALSVDLA